jgi:hypothetical protein
MLLESFVRIKIYIYLVNISFLDIRPSFILHKFIEYQVFFINLAIQILI